MRTRIFLRTAEFLWQEGHTAHATKDEAIEETERMCDVYADFAENYMAMPVIKGLKSPSERFAGADETYCIEAMMQDGKALQAGTSHFLGQNFAKAFDVKFADKDGKLEHVWATSWGVSTRLMGALIMTHSDDEGLVLPPELAPIQVVGVPIYKSQEDLDAISERFNELAAKLKAKGISFKYDDDDNRRPGWKFAEYEAKGVPVRLAMGPRDLENGNVELARRDLKSKEVVSFDGVDETIEALLKEIQESLFAKALDFRTNNMRKIDSYEEFKDKIESEGGFFLAHWDGTEETEEKIKNETKATIRCIPLDREDESGVCMYSGKPSAGRVVFAKAY
jgi:prolyl-tRNA synthetase